MRAKGILTLVLICLSSALQAKMIISQVGFDTKQEQGLLRINFTGNMDEFPELKVIQNKVYVYLPKSSITSKQHKKVAFAGTHPDTTIQLDSWQKADSRVWIELPFNVQKHEHKVAVQIKDNTIEVTVPKLPAEKSFQPVQAERKVTAAPTVSVAEKKQAAQILDENYLKSLEAQAKSATKIEAKTATTAPAKPNWLEEAPAPKNKKQGFNLMEYGAKFAAFLGMILMLFYGVVTLFKKGVIKKGRLGFLQKTEQVQVISQTYVAPKKSLMLVKVYNQVFLVSNTDAGMSLISEISDPTGLIKASEKEVAGNNFDDNVGAAEADPAAIEKVKLKEDIAQSNMSSSLSDYLNVKEKVKFSEQIKKKAKGLKPLQ